MWISIQQTVLINILFGYPESTPVEFEMSVVQVGNSLRVTLPVEIVKAMGLKKGDKVGMVLENSHLRLRMLPKQGT